MNKLSIKWSVTYDVLTALVWAVTTATAGVVVGVAVVLVMAYAIGVPFKMIFIKKYPMTKEALNMARMHHY